MFQAELHLQQDKPCVLDEFAAEFEVAYDVAIEELHDNLVTFVIQVEEVREEYRDFFERSGQVEYVRQLDEASYLVAKESCGAYAAVDQNHAVLRRHTAIDRHRRVYTVLFFQREDLQAIVEGFEAIGTVSLQKVKRFDQPTSTLTDRQLEVIQCAFDEGYFDWPRRIDSGELAAKIGISRSTLHEHLRKAQSKLIAEALEDVNRPGPSGITDPGRP